MDLNTRKFINNLASNVIKEYDIAIPICDIDEVVHKIGGVIDGKANFDDLCDGTIMKKGNNSFIIATSKYQGEKRRTFTIAHELGHLFLHMGYRTDPIKWGNQDETQYMRFGHSEQEYQANEFAAALLMPEKEYSSQLKIHSNGTNVDIDAIATYFHVSFAAAVNRGRFLGYLR